MKIKQKALKRIQSIDVCTLPPMPVYSIVYNSSADPAYSAFYKIDTLGLVITESSEPDLLQRLLGTLKAINFQVTEYKKGYKTGLLSLADIQEMVNQYNLPSWAVRDISPFLRVNDKYLIIPRA